jgi:hypothetical protein
MDASIITALAAVGGSVVGGLATVTAAFSAQHVQGRRERVMREQDLRERLYAEFIQKAAAHYGDSLDHTLDDPSGLIELYGIIGRIRLFSTPEVLQAAEAVGANLLERYKRPPVDPIAALANHEELVAPMVAFTAICRREREAILRHF